MVANGRIAGISGLLGSLLQRTGEGRGETLFLLLGIIAAPLLWRAVSAVPPVRFSTAPGLLMVAGLLVGALWQWLHLAFAHGDGLCIRRKICGDQRLGGRTAGYSPIKPAPVRLSHANA